MTAGTVLSGKGGYVISGSTTLDHIGTWSFTDEVMEHDFATNSTAGRKNRIAGVGDSSGSFEGMVHAGGAIPVKPGDSVTLKLHVDGTNYIQVPVLITTIDVECDMNDGEPVGYTAEFGGNGAVTYNGGSLV
jgi:hypothetical protein